MLLIENPPQHMTKHTEKRFLRSSSYQRRNWFCRCLPLCLPIPVYVRISRFLFGQSCYCKNKPEELSWSPYPLHVALQEKIDRAFVVVAGITQKHWMQGGKRLPRRHILHAFLD